MMSIPQENIKEGTSAPVTYFIMKEGKIIKIILSNADVLVHSHPIFKLMKTAWANSIQLIIQNTY